MTSCRSSVFEWTEGSGQWAALTTMGGFTMQLLSQKQAEVGTVNLDHSFIHLYQGTLWRLCVSTGNRCKLDREGPWLHGNYNPEERNRSQQFNSIWGPHHRVMFRERSEVRVPQWRGHIQEQEPVTQRWERRVKRAVGCPLLSRRGTKPKALKWEWARLSESQTIGL